MGGALKTLTQSIPLKCAHLAIMLMRRIVFLSRNLNVLSVGIRKTQT